MSRKILTRFRIWRYENEDTQHFVENESGIPLSQRFDPSLFQNSFFLGSNLRPNSAAAVDIPANSIKRIRDTALETMLVLDRVWPILPDASMLRHLALRRPQPGGFCHSRSSART